MAYIVWSHLTPKFGGPTGREKQKALLDKSKTQPAESRGGFVAVYPRTTLPCLRVASTQALTYTHMWASHPLEVHQTRLTLSCLANL
jgi:hypothetical protein